MAYHYSTQVKRPFAQVVSEITEALKRQGFGIITSIDMRETLKEKIKVDFRDYKILGACNPQFAHKALSMEPHIGVMLPCNVAVQQRENGLVEVSAINPMETMESALSAEMKEIAAEVSHRLRVAVDELRETTPSDPDKTKKAIQR